MPQQKIASNELEFSANVFSITGAISVSAGSNTAPGFTTAGDTNTGMFFPAADTIAFSEGGVESMRITSSGDVGIGNSSPEQKLDVSGIILSRAGDFRSRRDGSDTAVGGAVYLLQNNAGTRYWGTQLGASNSYDWWYFNGSAWAQYMRLDTSGNLGIGTTSPLTPVHAVGAIQSQRSGAAQYARMINSGGTATFISDNQASGTYTGFQFQGLSTASGTAVTYATINGSGNVGIGTSSPTFRLDVVGSVFTNGDAVRNMMLFDTQSASAGVGGGITFGGYYTGTTDAVNDFAGIQGFKENSTAGNYAGALRFTTRVNGGSPTERMRINSSGYVTMPFQPSFSAYRTTFVNNDTVIVFPNTYTNVSSSFNTSNGRFTAPIAGTYYFYATALSLTNTSTSRVRMRVNGTSKSGEWRMPATLTGGSGDRYMWGSMHLIYFLNIGDYVDVFYNNDDGVSQLYGDGTPYTTFGGYLVG